MKNGKLMEGKINEKKNNRRCNTEGKKNVCVCRNGKLFITIHMARK